MKLFFLANYTIFGLAWLTQLLIVRLYGLESFAHYTLFLSLMAFVEAPIIAGRSDSALAALNKSSRKTALVAATIARDFTATLALAPMIIAIVGLYIGWWEALMALLIILVQSGYSAAKNYFVVEKWRLRLVGGELAVTIGHVLLLLLALMFGSDALVLIGVYLIYSVSKSMVFFALIFFMRGVANEDGGFAGEEAVRDKSAYKPFSPVLVARNIALNSFNNLDVLLLAAKAMPELLAVYKIIKTVAGLMFRLVGPLWRWKLYDLNEVKQQANEALYRHEQLKAGGIAGLAMLAAMLAFYFVGVPFIDLSYGLDITPYGLPVLLLVAMSFAANWFLAWFKIDMLFEARKFITFLVPLSYAAGLSGVAYMIDDARRLIAGMAIFTIGFVVVVSLARLLPLRRVAA